MTDGEDDRVDARAEERAELAAFLGALGVGHGATVLVHASLGGLGLTATTVRDALRQAIGPRGTLVGPTCTPENSDTSRAHRRRTAHLSEAEKEVFRAKMPPYDPRRTPCPSMGALAEEVRRTPGARRSAHPQTSFAALGPAAHRLTDGHDPRDHLGETSPLAALDAEDDALVLLLRTGFASCTAFHLAEYRHRPHPARRTYRCVVERTGNWMTYRDVVLDDSDFPAIGARMPSSLVERRTLAGRAVRLFRLSDAVAHANEDMTEHRR
jgi:aminoglycoside 3-N-acetyltransferase